jgi:hypothetical protein
MEANITMRDLTGKVMGLQWGNKGVYIYIYIYNHDAFS